jgi:hypothetical protein
LYIIQQKISEQEKKTTKKFMAKGESLKILKIRRTSQASRKNERLINFEGKGRPQLADIVRQGPQEMA